MPTPKSESTIFFLCDIQTKFRPTIHGFDQVISTTNKLLKFAKVLGIEVVCTTQYAKALGPTDPTIDLEALGSLLHGPFDKKEFSMFIPEVHAILESRPSLKSVVIFGIEAHVCVTQTALSILTMPRQEPFNVYIVADGVSSANSFEVPIALAHLRQEGAWVTTSESLGFQLIGSAAHPQFKAFSQLIKDYKGATTEAGEVILQGKSVSTIGQLKNLKL
ncbi:Isochorismatase-like protein [Collybia nuda]|uniref:Isochorismatase-like protein n=1 Tax=Collybia nuda TaxID=64659 RepID=A0A9P5YF62_9AGAR|nr:Isochorismatase-like protein [Collybia nuda]